MPYRKLKYFPIIRKISDDLWDEIKLPLPSEKPNNNIGHHIIPFALFWMEFYICNVVHKRRQHFVYDYVNRARNAEGIGTRFL
ncbi:MAG: hypothetical protein WBL88_11900 [Nitrososphaeraceae archaeon]